MKYNTQKYLIMICTLIIAIYLPACKKFLELSPPVTSLTGENVYTSNSTAIAAVTNMYAQLGVSDGSIGRITSITQYSGLSSDELGLIQNAGRQWEVATACYKNELNPDLTPELWIRLYSHVYLSNSAIEGLSLSNSLTESIKQQLYGEAYFMRAFCYFYLTNLYGDVPLVLTTDYKSTSNITRTSQAVVYEQVISDLLDAKQALSAGYLEPDLLTSKVTTERVRPNASTATALLARAYLFIKDYKNAEKQATEIIENKSTYALSTLTAAFLKDPLVNKETIWQIQGTTTGWNTNDARIFTLTQAGPNPTNPLFINIVLLKKFGSNDLRKSTWTKSIKVGLDTIYYPAKYKSATLNAAITEYNTVFRLAEQILIRAESRAYQNKLSEAILDLNLIHTRAGLPPLMNNISQLNLIDSIQSERQLELFAEWGHRWFDLKRTETVSATMEKITLNKGGNWQSTDALYPITPTEIQANSNLTQTPGY
jgi:starch-binding outer membrane protein, SusD/RagB family